jgi:translin
MSFSSVESSLALASKDLDAVIDRRETLIKESRDVISLCSKTIINVHTLNFEEAKRLSRQARSKLVELRKIAGADLQKYVLTPEQEFVEAIVMLSLAEKRAIPALERFGVSPSSYVLGLLDSIGEMKRSVLDGIRQNNPREAESLFGVMENLFVLLSPFAVYDHVIPGVRRKLDVARMLVEDVRSTITEERRRSDFMASISDLSSKLGHQNQS